MEGLEKGAIAQLGERLPCTQEVSGSIPLGSTKTPYIARRQSSYMNNHREVSEWIVDVWSLCQSLFNNVGR